MRDDLHLTRGQNGARGRRHVIGGLDVIESIFGNARLHAHNAIEACNGRVVLERPKQEVLGVLKLLGLDQMRDNKR